MSTNKFLFLALILLFVQLPTSSSAQIMPSKEYGELFRTVQMSNIFKDSKVFPDMVALRSPTTIMKKYKTQQRLPDFDLKKFILENFKLPASPQHSFKSDRGVSVAQHINHLWPVLTRKPDIRQQSSLIPMPHPYVVPGGRFREIYYWDTYFTILGLWQSQKTNLIKNMVDNFAYLIDQFGFIPNGNRTYYLSRSQPPFFPLMIRILAKAKNDPRILIYYLPELQKEYDFWMNGRKSLSKSNTTARNVVQIDENTILNRYWDRSNRPRQEAFREDSLLALHSNRNPEKLYRNLRAAAESGWDFSSRWLKDNKKLSSINTTNIIPVDLNSLLFYYENTLSRAYKLKGNLSKATAYRKKADIEKQQSEDIAGIPG